MARPKTSVGIPPLHDVDIRVLRVFKAVVECEGLAAAEERLGIGRSTISKHISGFETRLNLRLCERGRTGFTVTPHGRTVYEATIELLDALDNFRSKVGNAKGRLSGSAKLWTMDNSHNERGLPLSNALRLFKRRDGDVSIYLNAADPKSVEDAVANGLAHIGITIANAGLPGLTYERIGTETTSLYCSVEHPAAKQARKGPVATKDLLNCDFVMRSYLRSENKIDAGKVRTTASTGHIEATLQLILSGSFVGILPDHIAARWVSLGRITAIENSDFAGLSGIFLTFRDNADNNPTIAALLADLRQSYRRN